MGETLPPYSEAPPPARRTLNGGSIALVFDSPNINTDTSPIEYTQPSLKGGSIPLTLSSTNDSTTKPHHQGRFPQSSAYTTPQEQVPTSSSPTTTTIPIPSST
ncbi:hypothetical protein ONS95_005789 [Cadophora gregata]|uniref:uncharacterized protein n=1 Tax=Cadophora gregata TaxID=51156 RepID=UPI0026DC827D|nr:uncharacterized protein ONS95_005789 [Cadophora gregata]KAK0103787.1 hypothetical protein ONS95_005789 [Cadophora gregata]